MQKSSAVAVVTLALLVLTGCASAADDSPSKPESKPQSATTEEVEATPEPTAEPTPAVDITAEGEVCDPHNLNDPICAAFYPDQSVLNRTNADRGRQPLSALPDDERVALAHQACDNMTAGNRNPLIETIPNEGDQAGMEDWNNLVLYSAGAMSYCPEFMEPSGFDDQPDRNIRILAFYKAMTEEEAKAHFADHVMPTKEELGY